MGKKNITGWSIVVKTGDHKGSGSDANIYIAFLDANGMRSEDIKLDVQWRDDFERGKEEAFPCDSLAKKNNLETPCTIELWRDDHGGRNWYCEVITLKTPKAELKFPVLRWVEPEYRYKIPVNDTSLPQDDPFPEQRKDELVRSREKYRFIQLLPNLPVLSEHLPEEENFSDDVFGDLISNRGAARWAIFFGCLDPREMTKFDHVDRLFALKSIFPRPRLADFWQSDELFGAQRLVGNAPMLIRLCETIPESFAVTEELVAPYLEGETLQSALENKKLFLTDLGVMDGVLHKDTRHLCAPRGLFFLNGSNKLMPIAIQLFRGEENPIFTPNIDKNKWNMAKMWHNHVEAQYHQAGQHLGYTHLAMEGIVVSVHRCMNKNHPIFRLLAPHFIYLLAINHRAVRKLIAEGAALDQISTVGCKGGFGVISRMWSKWTMDVSATLPADMANRGVADPSVLPEYPYRDDGLLIYHAIKSYVTGIVDLYYNDSLDRLQKDSEIQEWAKVLAISPAEGGLGLKGVPNGGSFQRPEDLILVCTAVIFNCSAQHATVNFRQWDMGAMFLSYPTMLRGCPPKDTNPITEEEYVAALPEKKILLATLAILKILSSKDTRSLGDWEVRWQYDPKALQVENRFKEELTSISETIKKRNSERNTFYQFTVMDPENIPNAISI